MRDQCSGRACGLIGRAAHLQEIEKQFEDLQDDSKKARFELQQRRIQEEVLRRMPKLDALGRAYSTGARPAQL